MEMWCEEPFFFTQEECGRKRMVREAPVSPPPRVARITRLMALALKLDRDMRTGLYGTHADIARCGHVTQPYVSQIMNLLNLAPDIQEELLFLPPRKQGRAPVKLNMMQAIAAMPDWGAQRRQWNDLKKVF